MSTEDREAIVETVRDIVGSVRKGKSDESNPSFDAELWDALAEAGMTTVSVDEALGGSGGSVQDAAAIVSALASEAGAVPVGEHSMVSLWLLGVVKKDGVVACSKPVAVAFGGDLRISSRDGVDVLTGSTSDCPWADAAGRIVVVANSDEGPKACVLGQEAAEIRSSRNLAGESRCQITFRDVQVASEDLVLLDAWQVDALRGRQALVRSIQIAAVLAELVRMTVQYCAERVQFGRELNRFQSVQDSIAELAGEAAVVSALADSALGLIGGETDGFHLAVAAAKVRASLAARRASRLSHQLHGAIGFTREHALHKMTTRLWSWSSEAGNENEWALALGSVLVGKDSLWSAIVDPS